MSRTIQIEIDGARATARLLDEKAPVACEKLWNALPFQGTARQVRWSGEGVYVLCTAMQDPDYADPRNRRSRRPENPHSFLQVGSINYRHENGELLFCYGQAQARDQGGNSWAAHIADLDQGCGELLATLERVASTGSKRMTITRIE